MTLSTKQLNLIIISLFITTVVLSGICVYQLKLKKDNCINNPLIYGARELSEVNHAEFSCTCSLISDKPSFVSPIVKFDQYGIDVKHVTEEIEQREYDFSGIEEMFVD